MYLFEIKRIYGPYQAYFMQDIDFNKEVFSSFIETIFFIKNSFYFCNTAVIGDSLIHKYLENT